MVKFFWMPIQIWYYVIIPIIVILLAYFLFTVVYRRKKDSYYYDYVVDYVYSTLGIVFCSLLFCLLLGYSIATIQILITNLFERYYVLGIILIILPIVPSCFLVYVVRVYIKNLKRKERLDAALEASSSSLDIETEEVETSKPEVEIEETKPEPEVAKIQASTYQESDFELKKKK